jgi:hypothetical protein
MLHDLEIRSNLLKLYGKETSCMASAEPLGIQRSENTR